MQDHLNVARNEIFKEKISIKQPWDLDSLLELSMASELHQDIFALAMNNFEINNYFVEIGAADGVKLSNTYMLETQFGWRGILAEPAKANRTSLRSNRPNCHITFKCVWEKSGKKLKFRETLDSLALSTVDDLAQIDIHSNSRKFARNYWVDTISLNDLLIEFNAPTSISYLSIDTEGSEFRILAALDFATYKFNVITVEHNYTEQRAQIFKLLTDNGYERVFEDLSCYDDWYVLKK